MDFIQLRNIRLPYPISISHDAWRRHQKPQPAIISVRIPYNTSLVEDAATRDDVGLTLNYGTLYRTIEDALRPPASGNDDKDDNMDIVDAGCKVLNAASQVLNEQLVKTGTALPGPWEKKAEISVSVTLPKAILRAQDGLECTLEGVAVKLKVGRILCHCIIGVNPHEREEKQAVEVSLMFQYENMYWATCQEVRSKYQDISRIVAEEVDASSFLTLEAMASSLAKTLLKKFDIGEVTIRAEKVSALAFVEYSGVEITRQASNKE